MTHVYSDIFFDYIDTGAQRSARRMIGLLQPWLGARSVLDLGCGRGVWLEEWARAGASDVLGVDGDYVDRAQLRIAAGAFRAADLTRPIPSSRRVDLAQSLEVGEHLPESAARVLVASLTGASDRVLFSAAVPGQGGEWHINEQPLRYWQALFAEQGYFAVDCIRPHLRGDRTVEPWYRYNSVLYVNEAGRANLPGAALRHALPEGAILVEGGDLAWRLRRGVVSRLPRSAVTRIAQARAAILARRSFKARTRPA